MWLTVLCAAVVPGLAADAKLTEALARMDKVSANFRSLSADMQVVSHMEQINEDDSQSGSILVKRPKPKDLHVKLTISRPEEKVAVTDGSKVDVYYPRSGEQQKLELGHKKTLVDMIHTLGFGGGSRELQSAYDVKLGGTETVAGESTTRLELTPKSPDLLEQWKKIELWISDKEGYTAQQKFYEVAKSYMLITYSKVHLNPDIPDSAFKLEVPKGTKRANLNKK